MRSFAFGLLLPVLLTGQADAFGTVNTIMGQSAEHGKITRLALRPFGLGAKTMSEIAGRRGRFGAVGAPDHPKRRLMSKSIAHCSAADHLPTPGYPQGRRAARRMLEACRRWITTHLNRAVRAAGRLVDARGRFRSSQIPTLIPCTYAGNRGRAKCDVLGALGLVFHAAQDFYSHSNWTDQPAPGPLTTYNPPGLGNSDRAPWLDPRHTLAFPSGLISGCFQGLPESRYCKGRVRHADLNKDTGDINVATGAIGKGATARGRINGNFRRAVLAAIADTRDKWAYFEEQVLKTYGPKRGRLIICLMRKDHPRHCNRR